uniref:hypothetical protein n=1 Tax=Vibrio vulnificus TaxID=672 RepID=UPI001A942200
ASGLGPEGRGFESLFTDHFKKACFLAGFRRFGFRQSLLTDVEPRGVRLMLEYGSSPTTLRKPAF